MGNLFSITGYDVIRSYETSVFGGFFIDGIFSNEKNISGLLLINNKDLFDIQGRYEPEKELLFDGFHRDNKDKIYHEFKFHKKEKWLIGSYDYGKGNKGNAVCEIHHVLKGLEFGIINLYEENGFTRNLFLSMLEKDCKKPIN